MVAHNDLQQGKIAKSHGLISRLEVVYDTFAGVKRSNDQQQAVVDHCLKGICQLVSFWDLHPILLGNLAPSRIRDIRGNCHVLVYIIHTLIHLWINRYITRYAHA